MYQAPLPDLRFVLEELLEVGSLGRLPRYGDFAVELLGQILEEAARFAEQVLAPINRLGDEVGASFQDGRVQMPAQFRAAYRQFVEGGWTTLSAAAEHGGQGQPLVLAAAVEEIWSGANVAFTLCPLLARGAVEALERNGTRELLARLLPNLVSGQWTGTMNLTEPQAGSDLAAIRTRATPEADHYRLSGQKIFITYGEHDMAENIVHMVLARIDGAPAGVHGISMFAVPKRLPTADGAAGEANDLRCVSIEHKLGIHASPTCVMSYGDQGGALGYLIGEPNRGLEYMFVMMNSARLSVGVQGIGLSELALQQARAWAHVRVQGHAVGAPGRTAGPIIEHPDVRRMLLTIRANVEAMRALALYAAFELDRARAEPDPARAAAALTRGELLIPIVKGWCTELATTLASLNVQIHGGMGFIEETGAAQTLRDVRITSIYEGTTGIQANDLLGRKLMRDRGAAMASLLRDMLRELNELRGDEPALRSSRNATIEALTYLRDATETLLQQAGEAAPRAYAVSVPYLQLAGRVLGGALMARSAAIAARHLQTTAGAAAAVAAATADAGFYRAKLQSARFYAEHLLPEALSLLRIVKSGGASVADAAADLV
ncbi:MAG TPA: acyl-CoA dehydrogenase [Steroidobacteraceae bacterium]|nr:acyl-CoA dehydrogenase [Steroidobacteraceae bacterium]